MSGSTAAVVSISDFGPGAEGEARRWQSELQLAEKDQAQWLSDCDNIERRYREERPENDNAKRFAVLWSNIQTLSPAVYGRKPSPVVSRRFRDRDPVARAGAEILMRALRDSADECDLHGTMKTACTSFLLNARAVVWVRYVPYFAEGEKREPPVQITETETPEERLVSEEVQVDFIPRDDFRHSPAAQWADVRWVARRVRMTREEGRERFGKAWPEEIPMTWTPRGAPGAERDNQQFKRAIVWEIWNKTTREVIWVAEGWAENVLERRADPLGLKDFFPCPRPAFGTQTETTLIPVPDYKEYRDQALDLDTLTGRISALAEAIKAAGAYDSRFAELAAILRPGADNKLYPIDQWAEFAAKGGLEGAVDLLPVLEMAQTLEVLIKVRATVKEDLYEITGIADVIRGSTRPEETATAQRIKGRYASMRLTDRQMEMARFVRDTLRLMGEVIAQHFSPQTLVLASNFQESDLAQQANEDAGRPDAWIELASAAIQMLKDDKARTFRIDIEDKATIIADEQEDKAGRVEFLGAVGAFLEKAMAIPPQLAPAMAPMMGRMLLFGARAFQPGVEMEATIEEAVTKLTKAAEEMAAQPPQPDAAMAKVQLEAEAREREFGLKQQQMQIDMASAAQDQQVKLAEAQMKLREAEFAAMQNAAQNEQDNRQHLIDTARMQLDADTAEFEKLKALSDRDIELRKLELEKAKIAADLAEARAASANADGERAEKADNSAMLRDLLKAMNAPKMIVRGPDGRAAQVRPIMDD